jgi:hypothetical protein
MGSQQAAQAFAAARIALGAALVAAPRLIGATWVGRDAGRRAIQVYSPALGARDAGIGLGLLTAARSGTGVRPWVAAAMLADATDLLVTLRHRDALPAFGVAAVSLTAAGSVAFGAWLQREVH